MSVRNERGSSDRADACAAPGVVPRGRAAAAETAEAVARRGGPVIFDQGFAVVTK